jgi:hypothetical protein
MDGGELVDLYTRTQNAAQALHAQAAEIHELTKRLEELTKYTPARYATTRAKVEARAALEQTEELGERLGE